MGLQPPSFWGTVSIELKKPFMLDMLSIRFFFGADFESLGPKSVIAPEWEGVGCMANCLVARHPNSKRYPWIHCKAHGLSVIQCQA